MPSFESLTTGEPGALIIAIVAFGAGLIRGFTGFGGPAFMLAILTIFFNPISVVSKVLVADFFANFYLFRSVAKHIDWRPTLTLLIPTLMSIPLGHWLLLQVDADTSKRAIAVVIALICLLMLLGIRYKKPMSSAWLIAVGMLAGIAFGGMYIALVAVVAILLGPYNKIEGRTLIVAWAFFSALGFALVSAVTGTTTLADIVIALPGAATYMLGTWLGSLGFNQSSEKLFRSGAVATLLILAMFNLLS